MASVTINFSAAHATRIQDALTESMDLVDEVGDPRPATIADLKAYIGSDIRQFVRTSERRVARAAAASASTDVDIT